LEGGTAAAADEGTRPKEHLMASKLQGKRIAFLVAPEGVEQVELTEPLEAVRDAGAQAEIVSTDSGEIQAFDHLDKADTFRVDRVVGDVSPDEYDGLVLPGRVANPDFLRTNEEAVAFVRDFFATGKPVGAICHAPCEEFAEGEHDVHPAGATSGPAP